MRRLAQGIVGALALAYMAIAQPWGIDECPPDSCFSSSDASLAWSVLGTLVQVAIPGVILVVVLVAVLGIRDSGRASDAAVYAALGQTQGTAVRNAARRGLLDGAVVTGIAYLATGILNAFLVVSAGYGFLDSGADPQLWVVRGMMALAFTGMLVLAHVIDAVRPRRTPVERLHEEAAAPRPRRVSLARRSLVLGAVAAMAVGVLVSLAVAHDSVNGAAGVIPSFVARAAVVTLALAGIAIFFAVGAPLLRNAMTPAIKGAAQLTGAVRARNTSAVLRARAATASVGSTRTVIAISGLALLAGSIAGANPAPAFAPSYVGAMTATPEGVGDELARQIGELPGVGAVVVGTATPIDYDLAVVGIDPADLDGVDDQLAAMLKAHPGAVVSGSLWTDVSLDDYVATGIAVTGIVPTSTCCTQIVDRASVAMPLGSSTVLIWAAPGADPAEVSRTVNAFAPDVPDLEGYGGSLISEPSSTDLGALLFNVGLLVLIFGGPVVALAYGVVQRRRREDATLAALGASRRSLTLAAIVETTVVAAVAVAGGLLAGATLHMVVVGASRAEDSLRGVITDNYLQTMVGSVAWSTVGWMFVIAVASFAVVALLVRAFSRGALPAEQLRAAEEGVLS